MKSYEKDTGTKIPTWYLKLPQKILDFVSDMGIILNRALTKRKRTKKKTNENKRNIKFYL